jgi:hypothetical protein
MKVWKEIEIKKRRHRRKCSESSTRKEWLKTRDTNWRKMNVHEEKRGSSKCTLAR